MMKKLISLLVMLSAWTSYAADNEIYVDQSGTGANIDLEQLGISNIIGFLVIYLQITLQVYITLLVVQTLLPFR